MRRVFTIDVQGIGPMLYTVHEDEIKRFHVAIQEWAASPSPRKIFSFHVGHEMRFVRLDMVSSYSIPDEVMAQIEGA